MKATKLIAALAAVAGLVLASCGGTDSVSAPSAAPISVPSISIGK